MDVCDLSRELNRNEKLFVVQVLYVFVTFFTLIVLSLISISKNGRRLWHIVGINLKVSHHKYKMIKKFIF